MTIHLPQDIERSIQAAVDSGHFASVDDAMTKAASLLLQRLKQEQTQAKQAAASPASRPGAQADLGGIRGDRRQHPRRGMGQAAR